jgi:tRNA(fMet)-specific endonuclease VapC
MEILRGRYDAVLKAANGKELALAQEKLSRSQALLEDCHIVAIEKFATAEFDMLLQHKKLHKIGRADLLIASIALARRDTLVTRNLKHFQQVPRLKVENWAD